ncbi:hypothetical protein PtA15_7A234 [Puccinia triticina]|uniref:Uncharacterized protein n=1 Tax=Puccinia triticina TaxID=208348 RepID=A0ABY7CNJ8_9BASI|nr:uncharacterized protein PtA15_7A234 [Puccinia triticina]WAQ86508.1 hypothetical protein PtA15_7A234 [Puccinia triticina]
MNPNAPAPPEQQPNGTNNAPPPGRDEAWITDLVDQLLPKFQGQATGSDVRMQTDTQGKPDSRRRRSGGITR